MGINIYLRYSEVILMLDRISSANGQLNIEMHLLVMLSLQLILIRSRANWIHIKCNTLICILAYKTEVIELCEFVDC